MRPFKIHSIPINSPSELTGYANDDFGTERFNIDNMLKEIHKSAVGIASRCLVLHDHNWACTYNPGTSSFVNAIDRFLKPKKIDILEEYSICDASQSNEGLVNLKGKIRNSELILRKSFNSALPYLDGIDYLTVRNVFYKSITAILLMDVDDLNIEVTPEDSIFYTLKKTDTTIYIQHFFDDIEDEDDVRATLTAFRNGEKLPSLAGSIGLILQEAKNVFSFTQD
jgi:hypothetical protein